MPLTDASAVDRARAGDHEAFRCLVERHSRQIYRLAYRMTGHVEDAEDVVQETLLRAYRELDRFEARSNFGTWLYRIAANCAIDLMRTRGKHDRRASGEPDGVLEARADGAPRPDDQAFGIELHRKVEEALDWLSPTERAAFVLRHFEDCSIKDIGDALGLRTSATKHSIFRAVRKVRAVLDPVLRPAPDVEAAVVPRARR
jgi:RNA polymerase sigma-70 factor (ECF subfamily)